MDRDRPSRLQRSLLLHLLDHRGAQVRFEADQWTTEFGITRAFSQEDPVELKETLRDLEMERYIYRRMQYVIGYSEPKLVFSLTPTGYHLAVRFREDGDAAATPGATSAPVPDGGGPAGGPPGRPGEPGPEGTPPPREAT